MKVLIVDDHPLYREGLAALVAQAFPGAQVEQAGDADAAFAALARDPAFDLMLLDLAMPGLDGRAALRRLHVQLPALVVVVISASEDAAAANECIALGARGFFSKSARRAALACALEAVIDGGVVMAPTARRASSSAAGLTPREREVLEHLGQGDSNKAIARRLEISEATVRVHLTAVYRELGVASRTQALLEARRRGLLSP